MRREFQMRLHDVRTVMMGIIIASFCCGLLGTITAVAQERAGTITDHYSRNQ